MNLEVEGRHALLFDDDAMAAFVNSRDALVEWNSLFIDRYDVRHLLSSPLPPRKFARRSTSAETDGSLESEIEHERFLDLPPPGDDEDPEVEREVSDKGFHAVAFSYGNADENNEQKVSDTNAGFRPSFPVPQSLLQNLPPTEKVHQIIERTAVFVRKHGGQSEIILRVKQGNNPTFGFLMPDHHLHPYFRFLIDHPELLKSESSAKSSEGETSLEYGPANVGGALSLLGSTYGSGDDDDVQIGTKLGSDECKSTNVNGDESVSKGLAYREPSDAAAVKRKQVLKDSFSSLKDKAAVTKKNRSFDMVKAEGEIGIKKNGEVLVVDAARGKTKLGALGGMKVEQCIVEPPSDVKRLIDKIVEFITKNGKEFEAVLVEQDKNYGRFPFLLPSNHYYPYYLEVLHKAEKSKLSGRKSSSEKADPMSNGDEKKESSPPLGSDIPYESDRKGKFKMIIGKTKKDGQEQLSKESQQQIGVSVDADAAAAILQAVRRGIKNPSLEIFPKASSDFNSLGTGSEDRESASASSDKAAVEADSAEARLTREEKVRAERLRRAKMFTALLKSGAAPLKTQLSRGLSMESLNSGVSGSCEVAKFPIPPKEGGFGHVNVSAPDNGRELDPKASFDEQNERRSKRRYRSRAERHEEESDDEDEEDGVGDKVKERDHKHSRKKRRTHRSSHHGRERHKHRKGHSSPEDGESRRRHRHDSSDGELHYSRWHRHGSSSDDNGHRRSHRHNRSVSPDDKQSKSRRNHRNKDYDSEDRDDGHSCRRHRSPEKRRHEESSKRRRKSHRSGRDLEEGEISAGSGDKIGDKISIARGTLVNLSGPSPALPSEATEVNNEFRAKIRAMLMSTM